MAEVGDWMFMVALPLAVLDLTGSSLVASTVFALQTLPALVAGPVAGVLVDRVDVWRLMPAVAALQAVVLMPLLLATRPGLTWVLYAVVLVQSVLGVIIEPCRVATVGTLVDAADLPATNQLLGVGSNLARLIGGPLGGLVLGVGGLPVVIEVVAVLYVAAAMLLFRRGAALAPGRRHRTRFAPGAWRDLSSGWALIAATPALRRLMIVASLMALAQGAFVIMFMLFVLRDLHGTEADVGLLRGVQAVGALAGAGLLTSVVARVRAPQLAGASLVAIGLLSLATWNLPALTTALGAYVALFVLVGLPGLTAWTALLTLAQRHSPAGYRGRVAGVLFAVLTGGQAVGMLASGLAGTGRGLTLGLQGQGCLYLLAGLAAWRLGRRDRRQPG